MSSHSRPVIGVTSYIESASWRVWRSVPAALISAGMAPRGSKLPLIAVLIAGVAFVVAATVAVLAENPLY